MTDVPEIRPTADPETGPVSDAATPASPTSATVAPEAGAPSPPPDVAPPALPAADASLLALVDRLAALLERSDLLELEVEAGGTGIVLRKPAALAPAVPPAAPVARPADPAAPASEAAPAAGPTDPAAPAAAGNRAAVLAPLTGIFYASPSPGSPPFVEVGREVVVGQVIGLIEAMKLFNEIKSDKAGRVVRVIPENGMLVKAKHPLIEVEPL
jgi:acetyl-CoA carboxylase biotin carboxyl carrier protein